MKKKKTGLPKWSQFQLQGFSVVLEKLNEINVSISTNLIRSLLKTKKKAHVTYKC